MAAVVYNPVEVIAKFIATAEKSVERNIDHLNHDQRKIFYNVLQKIIDPRTSVDLTRLKHADIFPICQILNGVEKATPTGTESAAIWITGYSAASIFEQVSLARRALGNSDPTLVAANQAAREARQKNEAGTYAVVATFALPLTQAYIVEVEALEKCAKENPHAFSDLMTKLVTGRMKTDLANPAIVKDSREARYLAFVTNALTQLQSDL